MVPESRALYVSTLHLLFLTRLARDMLETSFLALSLSSSIFLLRKKICGRVVDGCHHRSDERGSRPKWIFSVNKKYLLSFIVWTRGSGIFCNFCSLFLAALRGSLIKREANQE